MSYFFVTNSQMLARDQESGQCDAKLKTMDAKSEMFESPQLHRRPLPIMCLGKGHADCRSGLRFCVLVLGIWGVWPFGRLAQRQDEVHLPVTANLAVAV